ncbi:hypothetical protein Tco_0142234, partial [Tanacetum coccineum]
LSSVYSEIDVALSLKNKSYAFFDATGLFVAAVHVSRILAWQRHEHGVCSHGGSDTLCSGLALANLSHYTFSHVGLDLVETGELCRCGFSYAIIVKGLL